MRPLLDRTTLGLFCLALLQPLLLGGAWGQETSSAPVGEDELAPVRAIRERLRERLAGELDELELDLIMEGVEFSGTRPGTVRWDAAGERVWFQWKRWDEEQSGTWEYPVGGELRRLTYEEAERVPSARAVWDRDHQRAMWTVGDAILLSDSSAVRTLLEGLSGARPVAFSGDGTIAVLQQQNNLLAVALDPAVGTPLIRRMTDIRSGSNPDSDPEGSEAWLREQQLALFDVLERRDRLQQERTERREAGRPSPLYLGSWELSGLTPSPNLEWVAVFEREPASGDRVADVPSYVTTSGYTEDIRTRIKVGDDLAGGRVGILHTPSGEVAWVDLELEDREVAFQGFAWSEDSRRGLLQVRAQDNKDRWFAVVTPTWAPAEEREQDAEAESESESEDGPEVGLDVVLAAHDTDEAWINWAVAGGWGWLPGRDAFYFVSERDGYLHLYVAPAGGGDAVALTTGAYEVFSPRLHPDRDSFVFEASIIDPFEVQAYRLGFDGGEPEALTRGHGRQDVTVSPDGRRMASVASSSNRPAELYVSEPGSVNETQVTESPSPAFTSYAWIEPEIVHFAAQDGTQLPARLYEPDNPDPSRPAVIFVHGAGYLHNVHRWWSSYSREFTFHHLLMERGYTVLDIDYRGSAGYGRDWRTAIYRHMGGKDLDDQIDGAQYLVREHGIDPQRIGLYGGSYGGFITLMALFTASDHFAAGAALRPVTDWAHYNHPYTSNILDSPQEDSESYWKSSPIYFAEGLEDPLLIAHGVVDTNVHFQGVVRLAQRLIELRKENWEVAIYPVESHGFVESASWADEYRRILKLFEAHLK